MAGSPRVVFFDAGLTLLQPCPSAAQLYHETALRCGGRGSVAQYRSAIETEWPSFTRHFASNGWLEHASDEVEELAWRWFTDRVASAVGETELDCAAFNRELRDLFSRAATWRLFDDVGPALEVLREAGIRTALISNWDTRLRTILSDHGLLEQLDPVVISSEVGMRKPHPGIFRYAVERTGCAPGECWHVGDSVTDDVHGALEAGLPAILIDRRGTLPVPAGAAVARSLHEVSQWAVSGEMPEGVGPRALGGSVPPGASEPDAWKAPALGTPEPRTSQPKA
ncbi:MAG: HAD-IA family hydrolase [Planctomycetota bacterium]